MTDLRRKLFVLALGLAAALHGHAQRLPMVTTDAPFDNEALRRGVSATAAQCQALEGAVWAVAADGQAECIRYWAAGLQGRRAMVYIPPDQLAFDQPDPAYASRGPAQMQVLAQAMQRSAQVPLILLSRPGTFGSSGDHRQRRRELEPRLMSAALDEIGRRHGISEWVLVGLSGGGHTVASLLGWRSDIVCAVAASAVSSPAMRWRGMGRDRDLTGFADSHEPLEHLGRAAFHPQLRVFVLGDPKDSNVLWSTQLPLAQRLQALGVQVATVTGEGSDGQRHALGNSARLLGSQCAQDRGTPEILELAARGLKG